MEIIARNKKVYHDFQVLDKFETGMVLSGTEIKSIRANRVAINEAYIMEKKNELLLVNSYIPEYEQGNQFNHVPNRNRKLLAHKREIVKLSTAVNRHGFTLIPLNMYFKGRWIKLEIGLCKGKDKRDKRQESAKQEAKREIARAVKMTHR